MKLEHTLERRVLIAAEPSTVFRFFTDPERWAAWWGPGSTIEARAGGQVVIVHPGNVRASGEILELVDGERIVFSYGSESKQLPFPPSDSRVTITVARAIGGTLVEVRQDFADPKARDLFRHGWRYQLALFANVVTQEQHAHATQKADALFDAWNEPDAAKRDAILAAITTEDVAFADPYGFVDNRAELSAHIAAIHMHMPGLKISRDGEPKKQNATALVRWAASKADQTVAARGTNVLELAPDGRIQRIIGIWDRPT